MKQMGKNKVYNIPDYTSTATKHHSNHTQSVVHISLQSQLCNK